MALSLALTLVAVPASAATPTTCRVTNKTTGAKYSDLKTAVRAAKSGQKLDVVGICHGSATIGKDLTIKGVRTQASGRPTLDGDGKGGVVTIGRGATVTIKSLAIQGSDKWEPGVHNLGNLTLVNVIVQRNKGGGVSNDASLTLIASTRITHNTNEYAGGGVYNDGALSLYGTSTITGNAASDGGGVYNWGSLWLYDSSSISGNTATDGGGVWNAQTATMDGSSSISGNTAYANGGGVWAGSGTFTMAGSSAIHGNTAASGGGVYAWAPSALIGAVCGTNVYGNTPDDCRFTYP